MVSKAKLLYPDLKGYFERAGFYNVVFTGFERDALYKKIREMKPGIVLIDSDFNHAATPFVVGEILYKFKDLNIAAIAVNDYPLTIAAWFLWFGAKSCVHLWCSGMDEFKHGLKEVRKGNEYISPVIKSILDLFPEWPKTKNYTTKRQFALLILLCCGLSADDIADEFKITRRTVDTTLNAMFRIFHVHSQTELMSRAWTSGLVNKEDLRFYRRDKKLKFPKWAVAIQKRNKQLQEIYDKVYGGRE